MLKFFDELFNVAGINGGEFKIINIDFKTIYFEGFKELVDFSSERVEIRTKKSKVIITGKEIIVKVFEKDYVVLVGNFFEVVRE